MSPPKDYLKRIQIPDISIQRLFEKNTNPRHLQPKRLFEKNTNPNQIFHHDTNQWLNPFLDTKFPNIKNYRGNAMPCISNGVVITLQDQSI